MPVVVLSSLWYFQQLKEFKTFFLEQETDLTFGIKLTSFGRWYSWIISVLKKTRNSVEKVLFSKKPSANISSVKFLHEYLGSWKIWTIKLNVVWNLIKVAHSTELKRFNSSRMQHWNASFGSVYDILYYHLNHRCYDNKSKCYILVLKMLPPKNLISKWVNLLILLFLGSIPPPQ